MNLTELHSFKLADAIKFHDELNPKLWKNDQLDSLVRKQLLIIAEDFVEELGIPDLDVVDITISGSNAAFTWTKHSDLDLHILVNMSELHQDAVYRELFRAKKTLYNSSHDITVHGIPVELYVQDSAEPVVSLGEYSILHDKWIKVPVRRTANLDQNATKAKFEQLKDLIDVALKTKHSKKISKALALIKRYRQAGLDKGGEFSPENLAYKAVRSQGVIDALYAMRDKLHSAELTIEEGYAGVKMKFLKPGELRGSYTPAKLTALGFKKSQNGSWFISQAKWDELRNTRQIYEADPLAEKLSKEFEDYDPNSKPRQSTDPTYNVDSYADDLDEALDSTPYPYQIEEDSIAWQISKFTTSDRNRYKVFISKSRNKEVDLEFVWVGNDDKDVEAGLGIYNLGDSRKVFATIIKIVQNYVKKYKPNMISFTAEEPSRKRLYSALVNRVDRALPDYENQSADFLGDFHLVRKSYGVNESSGYIPSKKEANDPRFSTALTVDVKPDSIQKNAKAFSSKTSRAGIPPQARADGKITEALVSYTPDKKFINEQEEIYHIANTVKDWKTKLAIFDTIAARSITESENNYHEIRDQVIKSLGTFSSKQLTVGKKYIPIQINVFKDTLLFYVVKGNNPAQEPAEFGTLIEVSNNDAKIRIGKQVYRYPIDVSSANTMMVTVFIDSATKYDQFRVMAQLQFDQSLPAMK